MALKNKDGTPYTLQKPNPIMKNQSLWIGENYQLHNMKWQSETQEDQTKIEPIKTDLVIKDDFISELSDTKENKDEAAVFERKTVVHEDKQRKEEETKSEVEKTFIHCLPAIVKTKIDDLYGDVIKTVKYEEPISFEGVVLLNTDLSFEVWTDTEKISLGSILYPKTNTKRWWRVKNKINKANGWLLQCTPSDYQPSFDS